VSLYFRDPTATWWNLRRRADSRLTDHQHGVVTLAYLVHESAALERRPRLGEKFLLLLGRSASEDGVSMGKAVEAIDYRLMPEREVEI
jgi:hypothetical protein